MTYYKKSILIFIILIFCVFGVAIAQSYINGINYTNFDSKRIPLTDFYNETSHDYGIDNHELLKTDLKTQVYSTQFQKKDLENYIKDTHQDAGHWYLYVGKPDAQYVKVYLNEVLIGEVGKADGRANLWTSGFYFNFSDPLLLENNNLSIHMYSDYMTGIADYITFLTPDEYIEHSRLVDFNENFINFALVMAIYSTFFMTLIMVAWRKKLYNIKCYVFFALAIFTTSITLFDYVFIRALFTDYLTYKKIIITNYHLALTFATLGVANMLNSRFKFNIGMISTTIVIIANLMIDNMIDYRHFYNNVNYFLFACALQLIIILLIARKKSPVNAKIMLYGFTICTVVILRMIITNTLSISGDSVLNLAIITIFFIIITTFVLFNELIRMDEGHYISEDDIGQYDITSYMQGKFTIDRNFTVIGSYSNSCNKIFDQFILGKTLSEIFPVNEAEKDLIKEILTSIFDPKYTFKDGFIALLPSEITLQGRTYQLDYHTDISTDIFLTIMLSDITTIKKLTTALEHSNNRNRFIANAIKNQRDLAYLSKRVSHCSDLILSKGICGEVYMELHTIKGNLAQFGFTDFETIVHEVESNLLNHETTGLSLSEDTGALISRQLLSGFEKELLSLHEFIDDQMLYESLSQVTVDVDYISLLEKTYVDTYKDTYIDEKILSMLSRIKHTNFKTMLSIQLDHLNELSLRLEKAIEPIVISGETFFVEPLVGAEIVTILTAIFRNALVHGIEDSDTRLMKGKSLKGNISCSIAKENNLIHITIHDDGAGINPDYIASRAIAKGIITDEINSTLSDDEKVNLIFEKKLSIIDDVDLYAGRGIGLASVKNLANKYEGQVYVETAIDKGTSIHLLLPSVYLTGKE